MDDRNDDLGKIAKSMLKGGTIGLATISILPTCYRRVGRLSESKNIYDRVEFVSELFATGAAAFSLFYFDSIYEFVNNNPEVYPALVFTNMCSLYKEMFSKKNNQPSNVEGLVE